MKKTLAIMAAGLGSRYGGLKQLDNIDAEGFSIIDYSIHDAVQVGFNDVVFIIRRELQDSFAKRFSHLNSDKLKISYVFQETTDLPVEFANTSREKPWGTGHALLALRHSVKNNFALINADDFYGREAFKVLYNQLFTSKENSTYFMVGYKLKNTLSPFGSVSRGECHVNKTNNLKEIVERTKIERKDNKIVYFDTYGQSTALNENILVSMNFWGFTTSVFMYAESLFNEFLNNHHNNSESEFYIPIIVNSLIGNNSISVKVLNTDSKWSGITYKEDKEQIIKTVKNMKSLGIYPESLWQDHEIKYIFSQFNHNEVYKNHTILTNGHINDTYKIEASDTEFILQKINSAIFPNTEELINNKVTVSKHLKNNSNYKVSDYLLTINNTFLYHDAKDTIWSLSTYIKQTVTHLIPINEDMAKQAGLLLGDFHKSMKGYDVTSLHEVIPNFHNLSFRTLQYENALKYGDKDLIKEAKSLIDLIEELSADAQYLDSLKSSGGLPLRVTHNDAKLSNMLFDEVTGKATSIIDLDTIMSGIIHYDVGDAIRSICSTCNEDEEDLLKIDFNLEYYKAFMMGFLSVMNFHLSDIEKQTLPLAIKYMLYEQSLRFLTDHLNGNIYYKVNFPEHNLVRAKNQLKLLEIINEKFDEIKNITTVAFNSHL